MNDSKDKIDIAFEYLAEVFNYRIDGLDVRVNNSGIISNFRRVYIFEGDQATASAIEFPTKYGDAGKLAGRILHKKINPRIFEAPKKNLEKMARVIKDSKIYGKLEDLNENLIIRRFVTLASGIALARAFDEEFEFQRLNPENPFQKRLMELDQILQKAYKRMGNHLITNLARLSGTAGRIEIIDICGEDIYPGIEH